MTSCCTEKPCEFDAPACGEEDSSSMDIGVSGRTPCCADISDEEVVHSCRDEDNLYSRRRRSKYTVNTEVCTCSSSLEFPNSRKLSSSSSSSCRDGVRFRRSSSCPAGDSPTLTRNGLYLGAFDSLEDMDFLSLPCAAVAGAALGQAGELAHSAYDRSCAFAHRAGKIANMAVHEAEGIAVKARTEAGELAHLALTEAGELAHTAGELAHTAVTKTKYAACKVWDVVHHHSLPQWMKDNEFLIFGHRPQLHTFRECFRSIFRVHTETGNIWTHLIGFLAFIVMACRYLTFDVEWQEKLVFSAFFAGAILCMGFSWIFHAVYCHSEHVSCVFNKLDYCGIALLTVGSFVPWLYYSFYWRQNLMLIYLVSIIILGIITIIVSTLPTFATPKFRSVRAGTFIVLGLSAVVPVGHYIAAEGWTSAFNVAGLGPLILMAALYISGAVIYACRIPEKWWPGKFDIWFQSHQVFHVFVVAAAFVHYHGISVMAHNRLNEVRSLY